MFLNLCVTTTVSMFNSRAHPGSLGLVLDLLFSQHKLVFYKNENNEYIAKKNSAYILA